MRTNIIKHLAVQIDTRHKESRVALKLAQQHSQEM